MRSKDKVLAFLIEQGEEPISGERIAEQIGISRNAVWKAIEALRNEGCEIEAAPRRGYRLRGSADALTPAGIAARAGDASLAGKIHVYGEIPSTSTLAKEMALHGAPHGTTVNRGWLPFWHIAHHAYSLGIAFLTHGTQYLDVADPAVFLYDEFQRHCAFHLLCHRLFWIFQVMGKKQGQAFHATWVLGKYVGTVLYALFCNAG